MQLTLGSQCCASCPRSRYHICITIPILCKAEAQQLPLSWTHDQCSSIYICSNHANLCGQDPVPTQCCASALTKFLAQLSTLVVCSGLI